MDKPTKDCIKYLKKIIKRAEKGQIIITIIETDIYTGTVYDGSNIKGHKDTGERHTNFIWRDLSV